MGNPAGNARRGKQGSEQFFRDSQHMISQAGIEVDIGGDHCSPALHDDLLDNILKQFVEGEFIHAALFFREAAAQLAQQLRAGVAHGIDRMAEAIDQAAVVIIVLIQDPFDDRLELVLVRRVIRIRDDLAHHACHRDIRPAMLGPFERADRSTEGGIEVCSGGSHNDVCEGGVVTAAVIRVDQKDRVKQVRLHVCERAVGTEHIQDIFRHGILGTGIMDDQGAPVKGMDLGIVGIAAQGRELCDQVDPLEEILIDVCLIRIIIIVVERENSGLELVHQVAGGLEQQLIRKEALGQIIAERETGLEILEFLSVRQITEKKQETGLLKPEIFLAVLDQVADRISAEEQIAFTGNDMVILIHGITDDIRDLGEPDPDAGSVVVSQSLLYIVFIKQIVRDICKI